VSIDAISSIGTSIASPTMLAAARLSGQDTTAGGRSKPEDIRKAAQQFEAILVRQLLAPAIEPMMNGAQGAGGGVYGYMLTDVLANAVSQGGGLGIANILEKQLSPMAGSSPAPSTHE